MQSHAPALRPHTALAACSVKLPHLARLLLLQLLLLLLLTWHFAVSAITLAGPRNFHASNCRMCIACNYSNKNCNTLRTNMQHIGGLRRHSHFDQNPVCILCGCSAIILFISLHLSKTETNSQYSSELSESVVFPVTTGSLAQLAWPQVSAPCGWLPLGWP